MTRSKLVAAALALLLVAATPALAMNVLDTGSATAPALDPGSTPGLVRLLAANDPTTVTRAIVTLDAVPTITQSTALRSLGLRVQPMRHLPLAIVAGPVAAMVDAVRQHLATDVYPDERIELLDQQSSDAMGGAAARTAGYTGKGLTVAVVDSGCDASHPDLADHVDHNVKLYSGEYLNVRSDDASSRLVVPVEQGPYQNSDLGSGHGTHVAGIIAADGTSDRTHIGVAPDAHLVCYSIGEILFTTAVVTAYDHMLDQDGVWGIDVVNNSWGNSFEQFDPRNPVNVATKAVSDLGIVVVFAAGNSGSTEAPMSLNPFSQAPWVVSVAAGTIGHERADFSSNGLPFDNSVAAPVAPGGHTTFLDNRVGMYHPDVTAPGNEISSSCDSAGTVVRCTPGEPNASASGTSMAAPHIAGAAAVLKQANPALTPDQLREALQVTATPVARAPEAGKAPAAAPFWQVGYGYVDLGAAVRLVTSKRFAKDLPKLQRRRDQQVLASLGTSIARSDLWTYDAPRVALGGSDTRTYQVPVSPGVGRLAVSLHHPGQGAIVGTNGHVYTATVMDATGKVLGVTAENESEGVSTALVSLAGADLSKPLTVRVEGIFAVSDPDTLDSDSIAGDMVTLHIAQLRP